MTAIVRAILADLGGDVQIARSDLAVGIAFITVIAAVWFALGAA
jgi:hypothetical protein